MIINDVFIGSDRPKVSIECPNKLLENLLRPIWGAKTLKEAMDTIARSISFKLLYHTEGDSIFENESWTIGYWGNTKVYSQYNKNTNTFEVFRIGDLV